MRVTALWMFGLEEPQFGIFHWIWIEICPEHLRNPKDDMQNLTANFYNWKMVIIIYIFEMAIFFYTFTCCNVSPQLHICTVLTLEFCHLCVIPIGLVCTQEIFQITSFMAWNGNRELTCSDPYISYATAKNKAFIYELKMRVSPETMKVTLQHKPCDRLYSFVCFAATVTRILTQKVPRIPLGACIVSGAVSLYTLTDKEPLLSSDSRRCGWIIYGGIPTHWLGK